VDHLTKDEFLAFFPMFANVDDTWIDGLLLLCQTAAFNPCIWGPWLKWGEALFVAHWLALREIIFGSWDEDNPSANLWLQSVLQTGVSSFTAGSVSWTKDASVLADQASNPYQRTIYGQEYWAMKQRLAVGLVMVT
jgi:Protein of unknown function (DUF4054)